MKKLFLTSPDREKSIPDFIHLKDLDVCISTNEYVNENMYSLIHHIPLLVSAGIQTGGKGRDGRKWTSVGEGGVYISYLLNIKNRESLGFLSLAAGTAVAETIYNITGLNAELKWPNDVELSGLKAGGILIENKISSREMLSVIGIGLNVNVGSEQMAEDISKIATSLAIVSGRNTDIRELILKISEYLLYFIALMEEGEYEKVLNRYLVYLKHKPGDEIDFNLSGNRIAGRFLMINNKGGLVLKKRNGEEETFFSGEISGSD